MESENYIKVNSFFLNNLDELLHIKKVKKSNMAKEISISPSLIKCTKNAPLFFNTHTS